MQRSQAYEHWQNGRAAKLDEVQQAHTALGGAGPGRRWRTQRINHAYAVLVASHFQGFARELHAEAVRFFASEVSGTSVAVFDAVVYSLGVGLKLSTGNAWPDHLQNDFKRLGLRLWTDLCALHPANQGRSDKLEALIRWRNAVAHQDFTKVGGEGLSIGRVRDWRSACGALARDMDKVICAHLSGLFGRPPW